MSETLFAFDRRNYLSCQSSFRGADNQEYYLGDYCIEPGPVVDVRAERRMVGACSIIRLRAQSRQFFRRSWSHIRSDGKDVMVLWFVKHGHLRVTHSSGRVTAVAGNVLVTRSIFPFFMECLPDPGGNLEALHLVAPSCALRGLNPQHLRPIFSLSAPGRQFVVAERILRDLLEDPGELPERVARILSDSALDVLSSAINDREEALPVPQGGPARHLRDILRYIEAHISDAALTPSEVAQSCRISNRYLCQLLKQRCNTSYSALVWRKRLEIAHRLLAQTPHGKGYIATIAYRVGFKSPQHFSRMFRRAYQMSPLEYRDTLLSRESSVSLV